MKSTLLLICTLICLLFFTCHITLSGITLTIPPDEAWSQVVNANEASDILSGQCSFNISMGIIISGITGIALLGTIVSLFFLRKERILRWFRVGLLLANVIILLSSCILFCVTMVETMQPEPACMQLCWPWQTSYWEKALKHAQQAAMFLGLCCGMLSGVNCAAFYFFYRRQARYGN